MTDAAIIRYQISVLVRLVAGMFAVAGLVPGGPALSAMPEGVRRQILRVLQPAESALRRLIFIAARKVKVSVRAQRKRSAGSLPKGAGSGNRVPPFALFDPRKWFAELAKGRRPGRGPGPNISDFDDERPAFEPGDENASTDVNPAGLCGRLQALHHALQTIPAQAKRLARVQSRRRAAGEPIKRTEPLRGGFPPGYRKRPTHEVDEVLHDCDYLARHAPPDTS